jgi:hypothetical protein
LVGNKYPGHRNKLFQLNLDEGDRRFVKFLLARTDVSPDLSAFEKRKNYGIDYQLITPFFL